MIIVQVMIARLVWTWMSGILLKHLANASFSVKPHLQLMLWLLMRQNEKSKGTTILYGGECIKTDYWQIDTLTYVKLNKKQKTERCNILNLHYFNSIFKAG